MGGAGAAYPSCKWETQLGIFGGPVVGEHLTRLTQLPMKEVGAPESLYFYS